MFTAVELKMIATALSMSAKSAQRLAARDGQPETVAAEYRKVLGETAVLQRKVLAELDKIGNKK